MLDQMVDHTIAAVVDVVAAWADPSAGATVLDQSSAFPTLPLLLLLRRSCKAVAAAAAAATTAAAAVEEEEEAVVRPSPFRASASDRRPTLRKAGSDLRVPNRACPCRAAEEATEDAHHHHHPLPRNWAEHRQSCSWVAVDVGIRAGTNRHLRKAARHQTRVVSDLAEKESLEAQVL